MATLFVKKKQPDGSTVVVPIHVEVRGVGVVVQSWEQYADQPHQEEEVNEDGIPLQTV